MAASPEYRELLSMLRELSTLEQAASLLAWDERTNMPPGAARDRASQKALLMGILHERLTSKSMGRLIRSLKKQELSTDGQVILREAERKWHRASCVPTELVKEMSRAQTMAVDAWAKARPENNYKLMEPWLDKMIGLKLKEAEYVGYEDKPYDAMLDEYEPGMKSGDVEAIFSRLKRKLVPVAEMLLDAGAPECRMPTGKCTLESQRTFISGLCDFIGFDKNCGRIDVSAHPFTIGLGRDIRITVRYDDCDPSYAVFPAIHETGHALYEQGFLDKYQGTPLAEAVSMSIHESQSRLWENMVGRSLPFWSFYYPKLQDAFPGMRKMQLPTFYRGINAVRRSLIRTDADEVTYNLHVMLRFDIESAIFDGRLNAGEIPSYWNEQFERYVGIPVPDDARGCLQDIHWAAGSFGYFPSYALGNLCAAQLWAAVKRQIPDLETKIASGDTGSLLAWLRKNVHRHGKRYTSDELMVKATGQRLDEDHFIRYVKEKYGPIYGTTL